MKKVTLSLWLALAAAGIIGLQAMPSTHAAPGVLPFPTCPPSCPLK
jgi:hypothetical protein